MNETLLTVLALVPALVIAIVFHEVSHGWTALALGDPTAKERKRLSFNPIRHVDPIGTLILPGALAMMGGPVFGWAKPVPVNAQRLDIPRFGMMVVAAAGPASNLVLALFGAIAFGLVWSLAGNPPGGAAAFALLSLTYFISINVFLALFNLLPIPPFDGSHILEGILPRSWVPAFQKLRPLGFPLLFLLLIVIPWLVPNFSLVQRIVLPPVEWALDHYMAVARWVAGLVGSA